ncbi:hypothetical protein GCM10009000_099400 [Halobacterium noricense]
MAAGDVFDLVERAVELRPLDFLGVPRDDAVHGRELAGGPPKSFALGTRRKSGEWGRDRLVDAVDFLGFGRFVAPDDELPDEGDDEQCGGGFHEFSCHG